MSLAASEHAISATLDAKGREVLLHPGLTRGSATSPHIACVLAPADQIRLTIAQQCTAFVQYAVTIYETVRT